MANVPAGPPVGGATDRRLRQDFGGEGRQGQEISSGPECGIGRWGNGTQEQIKDT
jgi:hypothetical protein